jgi:hypothetical protein
LEAVVFDAFFAGDRFETRRFGLASVLASRTERVGLSKPAYQLAVYVDWRLEFDLMVETVGRCSLCFVNAVALYLAIAFDS